LLLGFAGLLVIFGFFDFLPDHPIAIHPVQVIVRNRDVESVRKHYTCRTGAISQAGS
jgi:hypothetical protein